MLVREKAKQEYRVTHKNPETSRQVLRAEDRRVLVCRSLCKAREEPAGRVGRRGACAWPLPKKGGGLETALQDVHIIPVE